MDLSNLKQINQKIAEETLAKSRHDEILLDNTQTQQVIVKSFAALVDFLDSKVSKTEVVNQLREIGTPDVKYVVSALDSLHNTIKEHKNTDLTEITGVMRGVLDEVKQIPKDNPDLPEQKFIDYSSQLKELAKSVQSVEKAVKAQETKVEAPIVNLPETVVNVEKPDLKPIEKSVAESSKDVVKAVKGIKIPELDISPVEKLLKKTNKLLEELPDYMPSGGGGGSSWVAIDENGTPVPLQLSSGTITAAAKPTDAYSLSNIDDSTSTEYYGYEDKDGNWYIKKLASNAITFTKGTSDYATAWTNRASQSYASYGSTF